MAPLAEDDRTLIRILRIEKHLNAYQMINEFPARNWSKNNLNRLIRQILKGRKHFTQSVMVSCSGCLESRQNCSIFCYTQGQSEQRVLL